MQWFRCQCFCLTKWCQSFFLCFFFLMVPCVYCFVFRPIIGLLWGRSLDCIFVPGKVGGRDHWPLAEISPDLSTSWRFAAQLGFFHQPLWFQSSMDRIAMEICKGRAAAFGDVEGLACSPGSSTFKVHFLTWNGFLRKSVRKNTRFFLALYFCADCVALQSAALFFLFDLGI